MEAGNSTENTSNSEVSATGRTQEKGNDIETSPDGDEAEYPTGLRLILILSTVFLTSFLTALEIGIVANAIPGITDEFHRLNDVGWYGSATFLVVGAASSTWGKLYKYLNVKYTYLASVGIFIVGSIVAAAAPNSGSVIVGRAFQGLGAAGSLSGSLIVINYVVRPEKRPILIGSWWAVFMVSTILGPIVGGAFTTGVTWRWCFWINLPLGGPVVVLLLLFLRVPKQTKPKKTTRKEIILQLDLPGFCLMLASLVCLTLALQWGGQTKAWSNGSVIATLVLWIFFLIIFVVVEWLQGARAMVPLKLFKPRTTWANALYSFVSNAALYQVMFYLPIYLQSIQGHSAIKSGVHMIPFLAFFALGAIVGGALIGKTRLIQPYQLISALLMTAGMALFYTLDINSPQAWWIGSEILFGFGIGLGNQTPMTAVQSFSKPEDVANSTGIMFMCQSGSGAYFIVVAQSIFANRLVQTLEAGTSNVDAFRLLNTGASEIQQTFSGGDLDAVLDAYIVGIKDVFACALAGSACAVLVSLLIPFKKLPNKDGKQKEPLDSQNQSMEEKQPATTV